MPPARSQSALLVKRCRSDDEPVGPEASGAPGERGAPVLGPGDVGPGVVVLGVLVPGLLGLGEVDGLPVLGVPAGLLLEGLFFIEGLPIRLAMKSNSRSQSKGSARRHDMEKAAGSVTANGQ